MDWTPVLEKLETLRSLDTRRRHFGSSSHQYRMNPCLTEEQIQTFETAHGITLPEEYRSFLLQVGDGGAGPFYGLDPLLHNREDKIEQPCLPSLSAEFPFATGYLTWDLYENYNNRTNADEETDEDFDDAVAAIELEAFERAGVTEPLLDDLRKNKEDTEDIFERGCLEFCHYGCGIMFLMPVTGAEKGTIWCSDLGHDVGVYPISREMGYDNGMPMTDDDPFRFGERHSFRSWYEAWLDGALAEVQK